MRTPFYFGVGGVVSADIAVPQHDKELDFYAKILTTGTSPLWKDDLTNNQGTPIIGLGVRTPEYESIPLQWMPHFQVADVAASVGRAMKLDGKELMHGKDDEGKSQWAVLTDPVGAAFGLIPVVEGQSIDASGLSSMGHIAWLSLIVKDAQPLSEFYQEVIGLRASSTYKGSWDMLSPDGIAAAEVTTRADESNEIPAAWLISLPVDDLSESLHRIRNEGGAVLIEAAENQHAIIRDPVGVCFALQAKK